MKYQNIDASVIVTTGTLLLLVLSGCDTVSSRWEAGICDPREHLSDRNNCGCQQTCGPFEACVYGKCECSDSCDGKECGETVCGETCGDCGCGSECHAGQCISKRCVNRECGPDGCGGSCGECVSGQDICQDGSCVCIPECDGRDCGPDGCGGSCGSCGCGAVCEAGICAFHACDGKECGSDGCGGSCGPCGCGETCDSGFCVFHACDMRECGPDGCAGSCGGCECGETCDSGACVFHACDTSECGDDGCGGSCGECPEKYLCVEDAGQCEPAGSLTLSGHVTFEYWTGVKNDGEFELQGPDVGDATGLVAIGRDAGGTLLGTSIVGADGQYEIILPSLTTGSETVTFLPVWETGESTTLAVPMPTSGGDPSSDQREVWSWTTGVDAWGVGNLQISGADGSGAVQLFQQTRFAMQTAADLFSGGDLSSLPSLGVLWSLGVEWSCGCCFSYGKGQTSMDGAPLVEQSIFITDAPGEASAWGTIVTFHEVGHYVARNFSEDDSPGGEHFIGTPVSPPFAWSEGWASFFAVYNMTKLSGAPWSQYWDIQGGSSFWLDYDLITTQKESHSFEFPNPNGTIEQDLDENLVAAILWDIWDGVDYPDPLDDDDVNQGIVPLANAVSSSRFLDLDRGASGVDLVDFVDAMLCDDPPLLDALGDLLTGDFDFPYDGAPVCGGRARIPLSASLDGSRQGRTVALEASIELQGDLPGPLLIQLRVDGSGTVIEGAPSELLDEPDLTSAITRRFLIQDLDGAVVLEVSSHSEAAGLVGRFRWPSQQHTQRAPRATPVPPLRWHDIYIDRTIAL